MFTEARRLERIWDGKEVREFTRSDMAAIQASARAARPVRASDSEGARAGTSASLFEHRGLLALMGGAVLMIAGVMVWVSWRLRGWGGGEG